MKIEIGAGERPPDGWVNLDVAHGEGPWKRKAQNTPWPTHSETVEEIFAHHVMEHIPAGWPRISVFNEAHRVLVPGGTFRIVVPRFPWWGAIADPTHLSFWVKESFLYFVEKRTPADYGITLWNLVELIENDTEIHCTLGKG